MASPEQREDDKPTLAPQPPHFFKIILPETLVQEKLKIPKKFVRKYGETLSDSVLLEVPSGRVWQIGLKRHDNGEFWLENGWKPFVGYYSLCPGHLVAFRYEGNSKFSIFIYDVSTSEIDYRPNERLNTPKKHVPVENPDDFDPQTPPQKKKRVESISKTDNDARTLASQDIHRSPRSRFLVSMKKFTFDEKARSLQRAGDFKTENPFFKVFLQPSYIYPGSKLSIPANFVRRHFIQKAGNVKLSTSDGRTWLAKYEVNKMMKAKLYNGWKVFVDDNGLRAGDVCVFEMIKSPEISLRVVIFRETFDPNCPLSQAQTNITDKDKRDRTMDLKTVKSENDTQSQKQEVEGRNVHSHRKQLKSYTYGDTRELTLEERAIKLQKAKEFKSENPFFMVVMHQSYVHKGVKLSIPAKFMQTHFGQDHGDVILFTSDGRTWPAKFNFRVSGNKRSAKLYSGWSAFAKDNGLKVGDVCVFELKRGSKVIFRVIVF